jgi:hypothetical protein
MWTSHYDSAGASMAPLQTQDHSSLCKMLIQLASRVTQQGSLVAAAIPQQLPALVTNRVTPHIPACTPSPPLPPPSSPLQW